MRGPIVAVKQIAADLAAVANKILEHTELALLVKEIEEVVAHLLLLMVQEAEAAQIKSDLMEQQVVVAQVVTAKQTHGQDLLDTLLVVAAEVFTQPPTTVALVVLVVVAETQPQLVLPVLLTLVAVAVATEALA